MLERLNLTDIPGLAASSMSSEIERFLTFSDARTGSADLAEKRMLDSLALTLSMRLVAN